MLVYLRSVHLLAAMRSSRQSKPAEYHRSHTSLMRSYTRPKVENRASKTIAGLSQMSRLSGLEILVSWAFLKRTQQRESQIQDLQQSQWHRLDHPVVTRLFHLLAQTQSPKDLYPEILANLVYRMQNHLLAMSRKISEQPHHHLSCRHLATRPKLLLATPGSSASPVRRIGRFKSRLPSHRHATTAHIHHHDLPKNPKDPSHVNDMNLRRQLTNALNPPLQRSLLRAP